MIKNTFRLSRKAAAILIALANAFNPLSYRSFQKPLLSMAWQLVIVAVAVAAASVAASFPAILRLSEVSISAEILTESPVTASLPWFGNVLINTTTAASEEATISRNSITARPAYCYLREELCALLKPEQETIRLDSIRPAMPAILMLLPGIIAAAAAFLLARYALLILPAIILVYAASKAARKDIGILDSAKMALQAAGAYAAMDLIAVMLGVPGMVPVAAYATLLGLAVAFYDDRQP